MGLFGLSKKDLAVGGATFLGSMVPGAGIIVGPLAGAALSTYFAKKDGMDLDDAIQQGLTAGVIAAIPAGGLAGRLGGKLAGGTLARSAPNKFVTGEAKLWKFKSKHTWAGITTRAAGRGVGAAYANKFYDSWTSSSPAGISELPVKIIS